jgi:hypothetical protein
VELSGHPSQSQRASPGAPLRTTGLEGACLLEKVSAHLPIPLVAIQTSQTPLGRLFARVEVLAEGFATDRSVHAPNIGIQLAADVIYFSYLEAAASVHGVSGSCDAMTMRGGGLRDARAHAHRKLEAGGRGARIRGRSTRHVKQPPPQTTPLHQQGLDGDPDMPARAPPFVD